MEILLKSIQKKFVSEKGKELEVLKNVEEKIFNEEFVVLIGPGHNGGDGLVLARELHLASKEVSIWCPFQVKKQLTKNNDRISK